MKIGIIANFSSGLLSFRKELIEQLILDGHEVKILYPVDERDNEFKEMGCETIDTPLSRRGMSPINDISYAKKIYSIIKKERFDKVLTYTIKPNIYGGLVTRILKVPAIINITGLGTMFEKTGVLKKMVIRLYRSALKGKKHIVFQNKYNLDVFRENNIINSDYTLLPGSGVNIDFFQYEEIKPSSPTKFLYLGRIMEEKGIEELLEAFTSEKIEQAFNLKIVGFVEEDYKGKLFHIVEKSAGKIEYYEFVNDPHKFILDSEVVINPSYHEGMSNVLLESGATGRVLLASNIPGCKEIIDEGFNGYLFEPKSSDDIIKKANIYMSLDSQTKIKMGYNSRTKISAEFDRKIVVQTYMNILEEEI